MTKTDALERFRIAKLQLQPVQDAGRDWDAALNRLLNDLVKLEAQIEYGARNRRD